MDSISTEHITTPWILVTHINPDTDAWACLWAAARFVVPEGAECRTFFVRAGENLPEEKARGHRVLHMDTGLGDLDQHNKHMKRGSSFQLLVERHDLLALYPGLEPILELTRATDNVEEVSPTSIHYYFKGLPHHYKEAENSGKPDWEFIQERVFDILDVIYGQCKQRIETEERFAKLVQGNPDQFKTLPNGLKLAVVLFEPNLRNAAFKASADAVLWTESMGKKGFYVGIQLHREPAIKLNHTIEALRTAEARARGLRGDKRLSDGMTSGIHPKVPGWYLHDSGNLILNGSRSHPLEDSEEFTKLSLSKITHIVEDSLRSLMPAKKIS